MFRIFHLADCPTVPMESVRGEKIELINTGMGTEKLDVHLNRLRVGDPGGSYHHHTNADNVYIVKRGEGKLVVEGEEHTIREDDVVYIPAGLKHSLQNVGDAPFEIYEIYAPAGAKFDFVPDD
jgi:mannose-6-phosphate isomerase-like protein (cupin superfamily)